MQELKLSEIWIYPIKSLGGIRLKSTKVFEKGLPYDRRWMLVDDQGKFMTQRQYPALALFKLSMNESGLTIQFQHHHLEVPFSQNHSGHEIISNVWDDTVITYEVNSSYSQWFSEHLNMPVRLVFFPETNPRPVDANFQISGEQVSLADAYPFLIIGQTALDELNKKLATPIPMNRFRPNFVFTGGEAHEEDSWRNFKIGNNRFVGVKPCSRCVLTTIDQQTAIAGKEPLTTLSTYRKQNGKIYFGQNLLAIDHLEVREGDMITF